MCRLAFLAKEECIVIRRDPNHYSKRVSKDGCALEALHPLLSKLGTKLKTHFLVSLNTVTDEERWELLWYSFLGHNFHNNHNFCNHPPLPEGHVSRYKKAGPAVIQDVRDLLESIAAQSSLFLHGTHTNTNESLNGVGHMRVNKRLHRTKSGSYHMKPTYYTSE